MKLFIVMLVALALLFAVGVGLGARGGGDGKVDPREHGWVEALFKPLGAGAGLDLAALSGPCVAGSSLAVAPGLSCGLAAPTGKWVRTLRLKLVQGHRVHLDFQPAGGASVPARQNLAPGETATIAVPAEGGTLHLLCLDLGSPCRLDSP